MIDALQVLIWVITLWIMIGGTIGLALFLNEWFSISMRLFLWWTVRKIRK